MKGSVLLGLLIGFLAMMFLPYAFGLISNPSIFNSYSSIINGLPGNLPQLVTPGFYIPVMLNEINPNIIALFYPVPGKSFLLFLPSMLAWIVGGLLSAILSQSAKKGIVAALVLVIVEFLVFLLMSLLAGTQFLGSGSQYIIDTSDMTPFLGGNIITPIGFGLVGGLIGGFISRFALGPEEI